MRDFHNQLADFVAILTVPQHTLSGATTTIPLVRLSERNRCTTFVKRALSGYCVGSIASMIDP